MKIRTKLFLAFAAALVFQLVQMLVTQHFIGGMTRATRHLDDVVTCEEAGRGARGSRPTSTPRCTDEGQRSETSPGHRWTATSNSAGRV